MSNDHDRDQGVRPTERVHCATPAEDPSKAQEMLAEAQVRARHASEGISRLRRKHGIWVGGEDGTPKFLPPEGPGDIDDLEK